MRYNCAPGATPQLLTMKEHSDNNDDDKDDPLYQSSTKSDQVNDNNNLGESTMIKEKVIKNPYLLGE